MSRTITKSKKQTDLQRAAELMRVYAELEKEKADISQQFKETLDPITTSMKEAELELIEIGKRNRKEFDVNKNLVFDDGYLHISDTTSVEVGKNFSWKKFLTKFEDMVNTSFKIAPIKKAFMDGDQRAALLDQDIDLKLTEVYQVKVKAQ